MNKDCTIHQTVDIIGKRWTLLVLLELYKGESKSKRFSELKNSLPDITAKILSLRLKELEAEGMISKKVEVKTFPVKCEYTLTNSGKDFIRIIKNIKRWALRWNINNKSCAGLDCSACEL